MWPRSGPRSRLLDYQIPQTFLKTLNLLNQSLHPELPGPEEPIVEFPEGKVGVYTKFFEFANFHIPISQFLFDILDIDLFNLISAPNPTKVKTGTRPRVAHEVPLLTATTSHVIDMEDTTVASGSSGTPSAQEKSPLDFANENPPLLITERVVPDIH
ncbi:hypothetical protein Tco_1269365 [Tanacetum coccineum]